MITDMRDPNTDGIEGTASYGDFRNCTFSNCVITGTHYGLTLYIRRRSGGGQPARTARGQVPFLT